MNSDEVKALLPVAMVDCLVCFFCNVREEQRRLVQREPGPLGGGKSP
jgi:hypothetical protein